MFGKKKVVPQEMVTMRVFPTNVLHRIRTPINRTFTQSVVNVPLTRATGKAK